MRTANVSVGSDSSSALVSTVNGADSVAPALTVTSVAVCVV